MVRDASGSAACRIDQRIGELTPGFHRVSADARIVERDLGAIPAFACPTLADVGQEASDWQDAFAATRTMSDELVAELKAADLVVIGAPVAHYGTASSLKSWFNHALRTKGYGAPVYSFGISPALGNWFDHVLRADGTFRYTPTGAQGLLCGKSAIVVAEHLGRWRKGAAADHQISYIRTLLGYMGIDEISTMVAGDDVPGAVAPADLPMMEPAYTLHSISA